MDKEYVFQKFEKNAYSDFVTKDLIVFDLVPIKFLKFDGDDISGFTRIYKTCTVPKFIIIHIEGLLNHYGLESLRSEFISLLCGLQNNYILYFETDFNDLLTNDFIYVRKQKIKILDALKLYYSDKKNIKSIQFNPLSEKAITIDNWFLKKEIFNAIINYYGISNNNFDSILDDEFNLDYKRGMDYVVYNFGNSLFNFLIDKDFNQTNSLKFIDYFLRLAQIENLKNTVSGQIELFESIDENLNISSDEVKALRQKFLRNKDFSI